MEMDAPTQEEISAIFAKYEQSKEEQSVENLAIRFKCRVYNIVNS